jgi:hypothetical protein
MTPTTSDSPVCSYEELCPEKMMCVPEIDVVFIKIQKLCNLIFLFEYLITASTCWSVPARLAGVLDLYFERNKENLSQPNNIDLSERREKRNSTGSERKSEAPSLLNISGRIEMKAGEMSWMVTLLFLFPLSHLLIRQVVRLMQRLMTIQSIHQSFKFVDS